MSSSSLYLGVLFNLINLLEITSYSYSSSNHNIHFKSDINYTAGQRIYVTGKLASKRIETSEGKALTASVVKAFDSYVLQNECASVGSTEGDVNQVEILAHIASDVLNKDTHSTFAVATHFQAR